MGDLRGAGYAAASQGGGEGCVPTVSRCEVQRQGDIEVARDVRDGGRSTTDTKRGDTAHNVSSQVSETCYDAYLRWYMDAAYPSMIAHYLYKLGLVHGHAKIQYTLLSMVS